MIKINIKRIKVITLISILIIFVATTLSFLFMLHSDKKSEEENENSPVLTPPPESVMFPSYLFKNSSLYGVSYKIDDEGNIILKNENISSLYKITPQNDVYKSDENNTFKLLKEESEVQSVLNTIKKDKELSSSLKTPITFLEQDEKDNSKNDEKNFIELLKQLNENSEKSNNKKFTLSLSKKSTPVDEERFVFQKDTSFTSPSSTDFLKSFAENNEYTLQNAQNDKERFISGFDKESQNKGNNYTINKGVMIPITLITGINTDLPGIITAQVNTNIYDSHNGENILIEKGTKVVGKYDSRISYSQNRVQTVWNSLITNKGDSISVPPLIGVDKNGWSGWGGKTDKHLSGTIASSLASGLLTLGSSAIKNNVGDALLTLLGGLNNTFNSTATTFISRELNRQPTITIEKGQEAYLITTAPITFEKPITSDD